MLDVEKVRAEFPILKSETRGIPLVYLDNAATTQVPQEVTDRIVSHYAHDNANVHRGMHHLAHRSTEALEEARQTVARFVNAPDVDGVVFTRGTTDSLNMIAQGLKHLLDPSSKVVTSVSEHHSNLLPWQQVCQERGAELRVLPLDDNGDVDIEALECEFAAGNVSIVALTGCSNITGSVLPAETVAKACHDHGALFVLDGAQLMRHKRIDIQAISCDYLAFSGHKMMAGTGVGVLVGPLASMELLTPRDFGGEMVVKATEERGTWEKLPLRLEAGTPNYVGAIALGAACNYLSKTGRDEIARYEDELLQQAEDRLQVVEGLRVIGAPKERAGVVSFTIDDVHPLDLCCLLDTKGVALRSGHNCAQPLLNYLELESVSRMSPAFYNTADEIDFATEQINRASVMLRARSR